jgi:DNA-binding NtrC family response regulator
VAEGRLREDLYYRLKVVSVTLPPLRERTGRRAPPGRALSLPPLARDGHANPGLTPEALDVLSAHSWPGNVRELGNAVQKALIFSRGCPIGQEEMRQAIGSGAAAVARSAGTTPCAPSSAARSWTGQAKTPLSMCSTPWAGAP